MKEKVPGVSVPEAIVRRLEGVPPGHQSAEGIKIATEIVAELRQIQGVAGVHVIAIKWEEGVMRVIEEARLLPRPSVVGIPA